jgi:hypothetical protein
MKISKLLNPVMTEPSKVIFKLKEPTKDLIEKNSSPAEKSPHLKDRELV